MIKYVILFLLITVISFFEIKSMKNKKKLKELKIYILFCVFTLLFGFFCISNPYTKSLSNIILNAIGAKY